MNTTLLLKNIAKHITLTAEETGLFLSLLEYKELPRKTILLAEGQSCRHISYVHSGAIRAFCTDTNGKEATIMFALPDWWVTDMYCFLNAQPAMMQLETVADSCIFQLSKENFDRLFTSIPAFEKFFRILMQNAYTREQLRTIESLTLTAAERYHRFTGKYPQVSQLVTQKQIASYLGITPEFLSVIRSKKTKG